LDDVDGDVMLLAAAVVVALEDVDLTIHQIYFLL
jgi:hypothetical protein